MADEKRTWKEWVFNRLYSIPGVLQWWARRRAAQTALDTHVIPFVRLRKPLSQCVAGLITTAGVHLRGQPPFDMEDPDGDATYREIPGDVPLAELTITHKYYNHTAADQDINVVFPLERFRELAAQGVIGQVAPRHFGFMGHIEGVHLERLQRETAPEVAAKLRADDVDFAFLTPG